MTKWQRDVVDLSGPAMLNHHHHGSLFATPTDGIGGSYADAIDTDTTETECLNVSTEEPSSRYELRAVDATLLPWQLRNCRYDRMSALPTRARTSLISHPPNDKALQHTHTQIYTYYIIYIYIHIYIYAFNIYLFIQIRTLYEDIPCCSSAKLWLI